MIVALQDKTELVIQFRPEQLSVEPFKVARAALGPVVPDIVLLKDEDLEQNGIWTYCMMRIPGQMCSEGVRNKGSRVVVTIAKSLGRILSKGHVKGSSSKVIDDKI